VTVTIGGAGYTASYVASTGTVTIPGADIIGNIVITGTGSAGLTYTVSYNGANTSGTPLTATNGTTYSGKITATTNYSLPATITVTVDGSTYPVTDYNATTGTFTIPAVAVTGIIIITGDATPAHYAVNFTGDATNPSGGTATYLSDYSTTLIMNLAYTLPTDISVKIGGVDYYGYTYTQSTGSILIPGVDITGPITINAIGVAAFTLIVDPNGGTVSVKIGSGAAIDYTSLVSIPVPRGSQVTLTPSTAVSGAHFSYWSGDKANNNDPLIFTMDKGYTVKANFTDGYDDHQLTVSTAGGSGTVKVKIGSDEFTYTVGQPVWISDGTTVLLTAVPSGGFLFVEWTGDLTSTNAAENLLIDDDKFVTANFDLIPGYIITASAGGNGTISPAGDVLVPANGSQLFRFYANDGYKVSRIVVDGVTMNGERSGYTFTNVTATHTIEVYFEVLKHTITITADSNTEAEPTGARQVQDGRNLTVYYNPEYGYGISKITIDGIEHPELLGTSSYTFVEVGADHTIDIQSAPLWYELIVSTTEGGYVEYSIDGQPFMRYTGIVTFAPGSDITLNAIPSKGYEFVKWTGQSGSTDETIGFTGVKYTVTLGAEFETGGESTVVIDDILIIIAAAVILILLAAALLWLILFGKGRKVNVVKIEGGDFGIIGKDNARKNKPYVFALSEWATVKYHIGENGEWKSPIERPDGKLEIPGEDVTDTITISTQ
jgi:hypothetical protein